jgi:dihydroflavonol-4-reductase
MSRRVLITGGTGFLGEHVVHELLAGSDFEVVVIARSHSPVLDVLADGPGLELVRGDVLEGPELEEALVGCEAVFHLAGLVSRDPDDGQRMMRIHVDGTRRVMELAAAAGVKRVVVASTSGTAIRQL